MNTKYTFGSKLTAWLSAIAVAAILVGASASSVSAQDAAAPAAAPATDAAAPAAAPATDAAAPAAEPGLAGAPTGGANEIENPYGIEHMLKEGDFVNRATFIILALMSAGSWYLTIMRLIDQAIIMRQADNAQKNFWGAGNLKEGLKKLEPDSTFRTIVEDGLKAAEHHDGKLTDQIDLNEWVAMSLHRATDTVSYRLSAGVAFLASVGSTAPFVGLFGTVWGILNALIKIGVAGQVSIDKVAGPLGEALIMTAIGLVVAVPAVLGYNMVVRRNKIVLERLRNFSADVHAVLLAGGAKRA